MTLKLGIFGALLTTGLIAGAGQAKAEVIRVNVGPARVEYVQPTPDRGWRWQRPDYRRAVRPAPVPAPAYGYIAPVAMRGQNPTRVALQVRAELDQAADELRRDVRHGVVEPRALAAFESNRQQIERDLSLVSAKGYVTGRDRQQLDQQVQEAQALRSQFRCAPRPGQGQGGGQVSYYR